MGALAPLGDLIWWRSPTPFDQPGDSNEMAWMDRPPWWMLPDELHGFEDSRAAAQSRLGDDEFARAWAEGQAMTLEQAVAYALEESSR